MPVTTSDGKYYEDEYDHLHAQVFGEDSSSGKVQLAANEMGEPGSEGPYYEWDPKGEIHLKDMKDLYDNAHKIPWNWNEIENQEGKGGKGVLIRGPLPKPYKPPLVGQLDEPKKVHIVRHGETTENAANTVRGWEPVSLNDKGIEEAHKAAEDLKAKGVNAIVSSDLQRAKQTASIIGKELGIEPQFDPRLRTWNVGEYAGQPCEKANPELKVFAQHAQDAKPPGGESFNEFQDRSFSGIREAILNNKDKNLAIITHNRVEATLKGWEKTGQDNPDIDYNEVVKEETDPGTIRTMTMQPDSTIMQGRDTFDQRFQGHSDFGKQNSDTFFQRFEGSPWKMPIAEVPTEYTSPPYLKGVDQWPASPNSFNVTSKDFRQPNFNPDNPMNKNLYQPINDDPIRRKMEGIFGKIPGEAGGGGRGEGTSIENIKSRLKQLDEIEGIKDKKEFTRRAFGFWKKGGEGFEDLINHFENGGRIVDFANKHGIPESQVSRMLKDYDIKGPEIKSKYDFNKVENLRDAGKTWEEVGKEMNASKTNIQTLYSNWKKSNPKTEDLSEWYKNQFEGGPVESEGGIPFERRMSFNGVSHPGTRFQIIDKQTGKAVKDGLINRRRARVSQDKLDDAYGGYRYRVESRPAKPEEITEEERQLIKEYGLE